MSHSYCPASHGVNRNKKKQKNEEYTLISIFLVSLFTNVLLRKTVNIIILECVYNQKLIKTTLS